MRARRSIKDVVYGANDGIITTFAIVAGVAGAHLDASAVVLLGAANVLADGFSMAVSNYLGSKSERDFVDEESKQEESEITAAPDEEKREMTALLCEQGYSNEDARQLSALMFKNKKFFTDLMMHEELGMSPHDEAPVGRGAVVTFFSFVGAGLLPIAPFLFISQNQNVFLYSASMTVFALFGVGALRSLVTKKFWFTSGLEVLVIGGVAAAIAYGAGAGLRALVV